MELEEAIKHAIDGNAILFLGAGFSLGATNKNNKNFLTAGDISKKICQEIGIEETDDLTISSDRYINDDKHGKGIDKFIEFLKNQFICYKTTEYQDEIVSLPWLRIYTTNYDNVVEVSSKKQDINNRSVITATVASKDISNVNGAIVHMNGRIENVNKQSFLEEFKITDESYLKTGFMETEWGIQFIDDINNCKTIIFVGYSLKYDLDLQRALYQLDIDEKAIFIDHEKVDENQAYKLNKYGRLYSVGVEKFSRKIKNIKLNYVPTKKKNMLRSLDFIKITDFNNITVTPKDEFSLFLKGEYNRYNLRSEKYILERENAYEEIKLSLQECKICIIDSTIGNGKTILLDYLASRLVEENNVYIFKGMEYLLDDVNYIKSNQNITTQDIILIDDLDKYRACFHKLRRILDNNIKIIATCRSSLSDLIINELEQHYLINSEEIYSCNVEYLKKNECDKLRSLIEKYGLWGDHSAESNRSKLKLIVEKYKSMLSCTFYMLLDSGILKSKMDSIFGVVKRKSTVKKFMIGLAINSLCNIKLKSHNIIYFLNLDMVQLKRDIAENEIRDIVCTKTGDIMFWSPIFSKYVLSQMSTYDEIFSVLKFITLGVSRVNQYEYIK